MQGFTENTCCLGAFVLMFYLCRVLTIFVAAVTICAYPPVEDGFVQCIYNQQETCRVA